MESDDGKTIKFRIPASSNDGEIVLLNENQISIKMWGAKGSLTRQNRPFVKLPARKGVDQQQMSEISRMASDIHRQGTAMRDRSSADSRGLDLPVHGGRSPDSCDGYPLQSRGDHPPGRVCRCTIGGPNKQVGWWAVVAGSESAGVVACGPPQDGNAAVAYTAHDEDRAEKARLNSWNMEQQRQRDAQAAADRERALQQQVTDLQNQISREKRTSQQQPQRNRGQVAQGTSSSNQAGSGLPQHSPNVCFSDTTVTEGDVAVIYLTNRCTHRVHWDVCVNRSTAPWNDHYPGHTDPGRQSTIRMWSPSEKTTATYRYNTSFDGSQKQPSC